MVLNWLLTLVLICSVTVREDFPFLLVFDRPEAACDPSDAIYIDEDDLFVSQALDSNSSDGTRPDREEMPGDDGEMPVILECDLDDDDSQTKELLCRRDHKIDQGLVGARLVHELDAFQFLSFHSFHNLKKLRT